MAATVDGGTAITAKALDTTAAAVGRDDAAAGELNTAVLTMAIRGELARCSGCVSEVDL